MFEIAIIGTYARTPPTRHGLADTFEKTRRFINCSCRDGYSLQKVNFRIDGRVIQKGLDGTQVKKISTGDKSGDLVGHHAQCTCQEMFGTNDHEFFYVYLSVSIFLRKRNKIWCASNRLSVCVILSMSSCKYIF